MFKCIPGNHMTKPGEKLIRKVTEKKDKTYPERSQTFRGKNIFDKGGTGSQIVAEVAACSLHSF